jgi:hypothetical protein
VPAAIKSLAAHLGDGDPVAWRAALRVFELSYGKPAETVELDLDVVDPLHVAEMTSAERAQLVARVLEQHPHLAELVRLRLRASRVVHIVARDQDVARLPVALIRGDRAGLVAVGSLSSRGRTQRNAPLGCSFQDASAAQMSSSMWPWMMTAAGPEMSTVPAL